MKYWLEAAIGGIVAAVLNLSPVIQGLVCLIVLDVASGLARGILSGKIDSDVSRRGMIKKSFILILVSVGWVAEHKLGAPLDLDVAVAGFFCVTEAISIFENAKACGITVPTVLLERFASKNGKKDKGA